MLTLYGIKNCDSVKRTRQFLDAEGVDYTFHDFRRDGIDAARLQHWLEEIGAERLVNRQSATWRTLDDATRRQVDQVNPIPVLLSQPTLIKRPVLVDDGRVHVGFDEAAIRDFLATGA